jgi:serine/threonine protein kinase
VIHQTIILAEHSNILSSYNAPEVFNQKSRPIPRVELKKCDIWAFGLLAWEVLLHGHHYTANIPGHDIADLDDESTRATLDPAKILSSALSTVGVATKGTDDIQRAIFKHLFKRTLNGDPCLRIGDLSSLAFMSKWR